MQFDFKVTSWQRITVPQEQEEKVLDAIKRGDIWYKGNFTNDNYHGYWEWHFKNGDIWYKEYHLED